MAHFAYRHSDLCCEQVSLRSLVADVGTPAYVYSKAALLESYRGYDDAFAEVPHVVCYSVKANGNLGVLGTLARAGAGADIVSGGELFRALRAGFPPGRIIFSGVGKTRDELREALKAEVLMFNVESLSELGSQLTKAAPLADAVARIAALVKTLRERSIEIRMVDVGGGLGIRYRDEAPPTHREYARVLLPALRELGVTVLLEPGRSIVGNAGILLTRVLYRKETGEKTFVVVDAAMNDLIRPALYDAYHELQPVAEARLDAPRETVDVVGPICESGDFLAKDRALARTEEGDLLAIMSAGAYASAMASNYNTRPRAVEVLVDGNRYTIVRRRETYEDLVAGETVL